MTNRQLADDMVREINKRFQLNSVKVVPYINNYFISLPTKFLSFEYMKDLIEICGEGSAIGIMPPLGNTLMIRTNLEIGK